MKKRKLSILGFAAAAVLGTAVLSSCSDKTDTPAPTVENLMNLTGTRLTVSVSEAQDLDLKSLFSIQYNGTQITVTDDMINRGGFKAEEGSYTVVLTYGGQTATSIVKVVSSGSGSQETSKALQMTGSNDIVEVGDVDNFDLLSLFKIYEDGNPVSVTEAMIDDGGFTAEAGTYTIVLTYKDKTVTSTVKVVHNYEVSILPNNEALTMKKGTALDLTAAFKVYIGSEPIQITEDMITFGGDTTRVGKYPISIEYDRFGEVYRETAEVNVMPDVEIHTPNGEAFEAKGVYISNAIFDSTKNFEVWVEGQQIAVNDSMLQTDIVSVSNKVQTGNYQTVCRVNVNGIEFFKTIDYTIYEHNVSLSHAEEGKTFKKSELTEDSFDALSLFELRVDSYMITSGSCNLQFVEESKVETTEPIEGKTIVPYQVISNVEFGKLGDYQVAVVFTVDGLEYIDTVDVHIVSDVVISPVSSGDLTVYQGLESYDYKTLFKVTKYDAETKTNQTITVTDDMIQSSGVDLSKAGTYTVTCTFEDVSIEKTVIVEDAAFIGNYQAVTDTAITISLNADGTAVFTKDSALAGTFTVLDDDSIRISLSNGTYTGLYTDGVLTLSRNHVSVSDTDCFIFAKDASSWNVQTVSGFLNGKTSLSAVGDTKYVITQLTAADRTLNIFLRWTLTSSEWDSYEYDYVNNYSAQYYINPEMTGNLFEDTCEVTLGETEVVFTFTSSADEVSFTAEKKTSSGDGGSTTPDIPAVGAEKGSYTGTEGNIELDGNGKATVTDSTTIVPNYNGVKYAMIGDKCILNWNDSGYNAHNLVLVLSEGTYTVDTSNDGYKRRYNAATTTYTYMDFLGNGIVNAYSIFQYGNVFAAYSVNEADKTITVTYEDMEIVLSMENGENELYWVSYPEDLYAITSGKHKSFVSVDILNHKVTASPLVEVAQGGTVNFDDLFKIEYMENDTLKKVGLTNGIVDISAVDTSELGYFVATLRYTAGEYHYEAVSIIHTYAVPYQDREEVGTYHFNTDYYAERAYLKLNADGTAEFNPYGSSSSSGTWTVLEDESISINCGSSYQMTGVYQNGVLNITRMEYGTPNYYYYFKDSLVQAKYSNSGKVLTVAKTTDGVVNYYYSDGADFYGEVNVLFEGKAIANNTIVEIQKNDATLLEAKISGTSLTLAGEEKGTYTGEKGSIVFDGFGNVVVAGEKGTYKASAGKYEITVSGQTFVISIDSDTAAYEVLVTDAVVGTYTQSGGSYYIQLDGFGAGVLHRYSDIKFVYTYDEAAKTVTIQTFKYDGVTVDDTFVFEISEDGSLKCTSTTYSSYVAVDSVWVK